MAINGPQALNSLEQAMTDIRQEESDIGKRLARGTERATKLRETEIELFRKLAEIRLETDLSPQTKENLSHAEEQARAMLAQHAKQIISLEAELDTLEQRLLEKSKLRNLLLGELQEDQAQLKALSSHISNEIKKDPDYETRRQKAADLREIAFEAIRKTEQTEADQEQKGRPYRDDPLFMYLWETGYGTRNYSANNLVRWLDSWVARLTQYNKARPNFAMLNELPHRLRDHAERQVVIAETAEADVDALETRAIDNAGGKSVREHLGGTQDKLEKLDAEILSLQDSRDEHTTHFRRIAEGQDPMFKDALDVLASSLAQEDIGRLFSEARRTPSHADDALVGKIENARTRAGQEDADVSEYRARLKVLATRRRELEDIEFEFKKSRFDDPRSTFREDDLAGDLLSEFLKGAVSAATYWNQWQKSQSWRPGTTDWGGGVGLPHSGRSPASGNSRSPWTKGKGSSSSGRNPWGNTSPGSSGGFSRPRPTTSSGSRSNSGSGKRSGSRGSRKRGGFKTGGGF